MPADSDVQFIKRLGRPSLAALRRDTRKLKTRRFVDKLGQGYLAAGAPPLVVFAHDYIGNEININGGYELAELETAFDWLAPYAAAFRVGAALDIGANIGNHTAFFAPRFGRVLSFEPNPRTFRVLSLNAELFGNVTCFNYGLSDAAAAAAMTLDRANVGGARVSGQSETGEVSIALRRLDDALDPDVDVKLVKIDVEGHEARALAGAERTLRRHKPIVLFEQHEYDFRDGASEVVDLLKSFGYRRFAVVRERPAQRRALPKILRRPVQSLEKLLFGAERRVVAQHAFAPEFHPFVIAVPDWVETAPRTAAQTDR